MINPVLIKELSFRNFGLLYFDLSHWQSAMTSQYGQQPDVVTAIQRVKIQLSSLAEILGGSCYRSDDNLRFFVLLKTSQQDFVTLAEDFFRQAIDTTELIEEYQQYVLQKHKVILHAGGCHFDEIAGIRKIWSQPNRAKILSNLHSTCVAHAIFLTDIPISSTHYLLSCDQLTTRYRGLVQERIKTLLTAFPLYQQWLNAIHIAPEILPNIFEYHRIGHSDPVGLAALLMESICQDRAKNSAHKPFRSQLLLAG